MRFMDAPTDGSIDIQNKFYGNLATHVLRSSEIVVMAGGFNTGSAHG